MRPARCPSGRVSCRKQNYEGRDGRGVSGGSGARRSLSRWSLASSFPGARCAPREGGGAPEPLPAVGGRASSGPPRGGFSWPRLPEAAVLTGCVAQCPAAAALEGCGGGGAGGCCKAGGGGARERSRRSVSAPLAPAREPTRAPAAVGLP